MQGEVNVFNPDNAGKMCTAENICAKFREAHTWAGHLSLSWKCRNKYVLLKNCQWQYSCENKIIELDQKYTDEICPSKNGCVKSLYQDKIIIFKPKMQKNMFQ